MNHNLRVRSASLIYFIWHLTPPTRYILSSPIDTTNLATALLAGRPCKATYHSFE